MRQERVRIEPRLTGSQRSPLAAPSAVLQSIRPSALPLSRTPTDPHTLMHYDANKRSMLLAYVLWLFVGMFGVHRFYLGWGGGGLILAGTLISLALSVVLIGHFGLIAIAIWVFIDAFRIPSVVNRHNNALIGSLAFR